jgi:hypothetical protein
MLDRFDGPCCFVAALLLLACSSSTHQAGGASSSAAQSTSGAGGSGGAASSGAQSTSGIGGSFSGSGGFMETAVKDLPGLKSISFHERTGGTAPTAYEFLVSGPELNKRLDDPLTNANKDIEGTPVEFYDVYYSDKNGVFQASGAYLTISGVFPLPLPAGGGLNLAEIGLNFANSTTEYGNYVASFVTLGDNAVPADVNKCIDGDLQTHTTMGNTSGSKERLRLTLGFKSTTGVPK